DLRVQARGPEAPTPGRRDRAGRRRAGRRTTWRDAAELDEHPDRLVSAAGARKAAVRAATRFETARALERRGIERIGVLLQLAAVEDCVAVRVVEEGIGTEGELLSGRDAVHVVVLGQIDGGEAQLGEGRI